MKKLNNDKEKYIESIPTTAEQFNFKGLIFISDVTDTVYLWNGFKTICIKESKNTTNNKNRKVGQIMNGFTNDKVDFEKIHNSNTAYFEIGDTMYIIIENI